jgi:hypothetical protein
VSGNCGEPAKIWRNTVVTGIAALVLAGVPVIAAQASEGDRYGHRSANVAKPESGLYKGKTGHGLPVSFRVRGSRVHRFTLTLAFEDCPYDVEVSDFEAGEIVDGSFRLNGPQSRVNGRFVASGKVRGTLEILSFPHPRCGTYQGSVSFSTKRAKHRKRSR